RTCCLRANENPRPLRCLIFRGSIPHPMQSLCTLRDHCRQGSRNTRYQAGAAPYLDRSSTGWIAPACLAHSFDHLVGIAGDWHRCAGLTQEAIPPGANERSAAPYKLADDRLALNKIIGENDIMSADRVMLARAGGNEDRRPQLSPTLTA